MAGNVAGSEGIGKGKNLRGGWWWSIFRGNILDEARARKVHGIVDHHAKRQRNTDADHQQEQAGKERAATAL
jgi:hypothetical protein